MKTIANGITLGTAKVTVDIVRKGNIEIRPAKAMNPKAICIHNTGNDGRGAGAKSHNTYIHNMSKLPASATGYASWHFSVDNKDIYQHIPLDERAWHTGDGSGARSGNATAIGIEICENRDMTPAEYKQAEENAIALTVHLMKIFGIGITGVKCHQMYSGKYCPRVILKRDGSFTPFRNRVNKAFLGTADKVASASKPKPTPAPSVDNLPSNIYGILTVTVDELNVRSQASLTSPIVKVIKRGEAYKCYEVKNGLYKIGKDQYCTAGKTYVNLLKNPNFGKENVKIIEVLMDGLKIYNTANWSDKSGSVKKGEVFTVDSETVVDGKPMYKLISGVYITGNPDFVKLK